MKNMYFLVALKSYEVSVRLWKFDNLQEAVESLKYNLTNNPNWFDYTIEFGPDDKELFQPDLNRHINKEY